jgi:hypothetical protein
VPVYTIPFPGLAGYVVSSTLALGLLLQDRGLDVREVLHHLAHVAFRVIRFVILYFDYKVFVNLNQYHRDKPPAYGGWLYIPQHPLVS